MYGTNKMQKPRRIRTFKSYLSEKYKDGAPKYDEIVDVSDWIRYLKSIKCRQIRLRYYEENEDWFSIQLLD
jgi:hypothetical protein